MAKALNTNSSTARGPALYVPDELVSERGGYPTCEPRPAFRYAHSPSRWRVLDGRVVPDLSKIPLSAGSQHFETSAGGKVKTSRQKASLEERGLTLIPYSAAPGGTSYVVSFETKPANQAVVTSYCSVFETPSIGSSHLDLDEVALADWLSGLVSSGQIAPPAAQVLQARATETRERLASAEAKVHAGQGALALLVEELKIELRAWETALSQLPKRKAQTYAADLDEDDGEPEPDPKTSRKRAST